ncbi:MAG: DoxX family protein, partial [Chloroflexota bacterium]
NMVTDMFISLGYPAYLVYPLGTAKLLGIIAILTKKSTLLKEWAYAGFFFNFLLAFTAHLVVGDGGFVAPIVAIMLLLVSHFYGEKVFGEDAAKSEPSATFETIPQGVN